MRLASSSYGKGAVRIMRVDRARPRHTVRELTVAVMLEGAFDASFTSSDNGAVVATDTIKNIVNIMAREQLATETEPFAAALATRFLDRYGQVAAATVRTQETRWHRLGGHDHAFTLDGNGRPTVQLRRARDGAPTIRSGIEGFTFMKSTGSGWVGYHMDEVTTLPETTDRIMATAMTASWGWSATPPGYEQANAAVLGAMLDRFAGEYSPSVQHTLFRMGSAALEAVPEIADVAMACPNKHYLPVKLDGFGLDNANQVFTATDEPHGQIECTVAR